MAWHDWFAVLLVSINWDPQLRFIVLFGIQHIHVKMHTSRAPRLSDLNSHMISCIVVLYCMKQMAVDVLIQWFGVKRLVWMIVSACNGDPYGRLILKWFICSIQWLRPTAQPKRLWLGRRRDNQVPMNIVKPLDIEPVCSRTSHYIS